MTREEKLHNLIEKVILNKFPFLLNVEVVDLFDDDEDPNSLSGRINDVLRGFSYVANFETSECLSTEEMEMVGSDKSGLLMLDRELGQRAFPPGSPFDPAAVKTE